jgi:hypothetical protein
MTNADDVKSEVTGLLKENFPKAAVSRVDVEEAFDSEGEPSFNVRVVFRSRPPKHDMRYARTSVIDKTRTWLSKHGDERFPYFSFVTDQDEKELSQ